jgi:5'-deoxynucleotidase YfbR-like HD superfamily hydrolase
MHTFKECMNAIYALSIEPEDSPQIDKLRILVTRIFHDIGEGLLGCDVPYPIKVDKGLEGVFDEIEKDEIKKYFDTLPAVTKKFLEPSRKLLNNNHSRAGKLCMALEYYGYISFAVAEIKTQGKGNSNVIGFYRVILDHGEKLWKYRNLFHFVRDFEEKVKRMEKEYFSPDIWIPEFTLRKILNSWTDPEKGHAWPDIDVEEDILERTMKTAFLATFLIPQEMAYGTRIDGYKILCSALVHKLDKIDFPVLSPKVRKNEKLKKYERRFRQLQKEHLLPLIADYPQKTQDTILQAYLLERDRESIEGRFFDAIKNLSYVLFAHYEFLKGNKECYQVFENCDAELTNYSKEFRSIKDVYLPIKEDFKSLKTA